MRALKKITKKSARSEGQVRICKSGMFREEHLMHRPDTVGRHLTDSAHCHLRRRRNRRRLAALSTTAAPPTTPRLRPRWLAPPAPTAATERLAARPRRQQRWRHIVHRQRHGLPAATVLVLVCPFNGHAQNRTVAQIRPLRSRGASPGTVAFPARRGGSGQCRPGGGEAEEIFVVAMPPGPPPAKRAFRTHPSSSVFRRDEEGARDAETKNKMTTS